MSNALHDVHNADGFSDVAEHERLLADRVRVDAYHQAITRLVRPGDAVLDLGTGSGILALLAARRGARHVYAVDHSPFVTMAERVAAANGIDNVTFVQANSRDYTPPEPIDVVLHEQMGDDLLGENMVENLLDLRRRVLRPGGRIVPGLFELYVEPIALAPARQVPFLWEQRAHGIDFACLQDDPDLAEFQRPGHAFRPLGADRSGSRLLADPVPLLTLDLATLEGPDELPTTFDEVRAVTADGTVDGFCLWFRAVFDDRVELSTMPFDPPTHWGNRVFRVPRQSVAAGEKIAFRLEAPDLTRAATWTLTCEL